MSAKVYPSWRAHVKLVTQSALFSSTYISQIRSEFLRAEALVYWLLEDTHVPKVVSSNPSSAYWMDIFSHLFVVRIIMFV